MFQNIIVPAVIALFTLYPAHLYFKGTRELRLTYPIDKKKTQILKRLDRAFYTLCAAMFVMASGQAYHIVDRNHQQEKFQFLIEKKLELFDKDY